MHGSIPIPDGGAGIKKTGAVEATVYLCEEDICWKNFAIKSDATAATRNYCVVVCPEVEPLGLCPWGIACLIA
jgi:hypothetical protein